MVYYPTVFIVSTSSPDWNAIRGWAILYFQVVTRARWTTVRNMNVFNEQHNAFSFTCYDFPAAFHVRRVTPWIVRTGKSSWCLIQGCHIGTHCKQYKWTEPKYWGQLKYTTVKKESIVIVRRNEINTKCGKEGINNFNMWQNLFWSASGITFFFQIIEITLWTSHRQLIAFLRRF